VIFNGEDELPGVLIFDAGGRALDGASYGDRLVRLALVAVADDVGERFFEAELNGELGISRNGVAAAERLYPGPDQGEVLELTFEGQPRLGPGWERG
jgi:hypothetical protein